MEGTLSKKAKILLKECPDKLFKAIRDSRKGSIGIIEHNGKVYKVFRL